MRDKKVTLNNYHGFLKVKSCLSNLMVFYREINRQRNNSECFYFDFSKTFNTVFSNILLDEMEKYDKINGW